MLSDLALVDWVALLIALVLLGVAGVAAYLAYASSSFSHAGVGRDFAGMAGDEDYAPNHAFAGSLEFKEDVAQHRPIPAHGDGGQHGEQQGHHAAAAHDSTFAGVPAPPILIRSTVPEEATDTSDLRAGDKFSLRGGSNAQHSSKESLADRASRLRKRPKPESRVAIVADSALVGAGAPKSELRPRKGKLSAGMESTDGFAKRAPGFFEDPIGRHELRYWNGRSWTEYVKEGADRFIDPM